MSSSTKLHENKQAMRLTRPPPLKINKESQVIQKPATSKSRNDDPVIIYMHSPKILHIKPQDFMAVVQRLTGLSPSSSSSSSSSYSSSSTLSRSDNDRDHLVMKSHDDGYSKNHVSNMNNQKVIWSSSPTTTNYLLDIPLFTPNSEFFSSPSKSFTNINGAFASPSLIIRGEDGKSSNY